MQTQSLEQVITNSIRFPVDCFTDWDADLKAKPLKAKFMCFCDNYLDDFVTCLDQLKSCFSE